MCMQVEVLRRNVSMYQAMNRRFACYVDGLQYHFGTFFYKDNETICYCRVSLLSHLKTLSTPFNNVILLCSRGSCLSMYIINLYVHLIGRRPREVFKIV